MSVPLQEAIGKSGGSQDLLDQAIRAGRVIRAGTMFYFPRKLFTKATMVKQGLTAIEEKPAQESDLSSMQEAIVKDFQWDPATLIPDALSQSLAPPPPLSSLSQGSSPSPTASLAAPFSLPAAPGGCKCSPKKPTQHVWLSVKIGI